MYSITQVFRYFANKPCRRENKLPYYMLTKYQHLYPLMVFENNP